MASVDVYNAEGKKTGTQDLSEGVFEVPMNDTLVHRTVTIAGANARIPYAHTKTRGERRGGGRKPWKQKGTGRARAGSIRSPLWRGGGVTFGPRSNRSFGGKVNRQERRSAMRMLLSDLVRDGKLILIEGKDLFDGKTKSLVTMAAALPVEGKTLFVTNDKDEMLVRASNNVKKLTSSHVGLLAPSQVLTHATCVMTVEAAKELEKRLAPKSKAKSASVSA